MPAEMSAAADISAALFVTEHWSRPPSSPCGALVILDFSTACLGFDHGVGHPLLLLYDAKVLSGRKNKAFKGLGHYAEWPKVADAVIKALVSYPGAAHRLAQVLLCHSPQDAAPDNDEAQSSIWADSTIGC